MDSFKLSDQRTRKPARTARPDGVERCGRSRQPNPHCLSSRLCQAGHNFRREFLIVTAPGSASTVQVEDEGCRGGTTLTGAAEPYNGRDESRQYRARLFCESWLVRQPVCVAGLMICSDLPGPTRSISTLHDDAGFHSLRDAFRSSLAYRVDEFSI